MGKPGSYNYKHKHGFIISVLHAKETFRKNNPVDTLFTFRKSPFNFIKVTIQVNTVTQM